MVSSKTKEISWKEFGIKVVLPSRTISEGQEGTIALRVCDGMSASCFDYPQEYALCSSVYEIYCNVPDIRAEPHLEEIYVSLTNFKQPIGEARLCVMKASRNPSRWNKDLMPIYTFAEMEQMSSDSETKSVTVCLDTSGCYLFIASKNV